MKREIVKKWCIVYFNESNQLHQEEDKPSYISFDGVIYFCKNGKDHRKGKLSVIYPDGSLRYYENDKFVKHIKS